VLEAEKAQPLDALGKEKADMTHIKHNLNPQDTIKVKSDNESTTKVQRHATGNLKMAHAGTSNVLLRTMKKRGRFLKQMQKATGKLGCQRIFSPKDATNSWEGGI